MDDRPRSTPVCFGNDLPMKTAAHYNTTHPMKIAKEHLAQVRVAKTYPPDQKGAKRFALRYGDDLVCVRHRLNETGTMRHTTVELRMESTPVVSRQRSTIALRFPPSDRQTRTVIMSCGAQWQPAQKYWLLPA